MLARPWRSTLTSVPVQHEPGFDLVLDQVIVAGAAVLRGVMVGRPHFAWLIPRGRPS